MYGQRGSHKRRAPCQGHLCPTYALAARRTLPRCFVSFESYEGPRVRATARELRRYATTIPPPGRCVSGAARALQKTTDGRADFFPLVGCDPAGRCPRARGSAPCLAAGMRRPPLAMPARFREPMLNERPEPAQRLAFGSFTAKGLPCRHPRGERSGRSVLHDNC
jgi:hypothetical protein